MGWTSLPVWCKVTTLLLPLLQSALKPLRVLACSTIVEYSQQEGFYRVPLQAARQTPNLEDQWLERSNSRHQVSPTSETTRANPSSGRWNYGREIAENFSESGDFHVTLGSFTCRKFTTWDRRLYLPYEGRRAEDFFTQKFRRVWTRKLEYQRPTRLLLDHRSCSTTLLLKKKTFCDVAEIYLMELFYTNNSCNFWRFH